MTTLDETRRTIINQTHVQPGMEIHADTFFHGRDTINRAHRRNMEELARKGYVTPTQYGYVLEPILWSAHTGTALFGITLTESANGR